jgi:hypothetical protein
MKIALTNTSRLFFLVVIWASSSVKAQEKKFPEILASVQPLFAVNNALRADIELKLRSPLLNVVLSPELYTGTVKDRYAYRDQYRDNLGGIGIGISHKLDLSKRNVRPYVSYGITYRSLKIDYDDEGFLPYTKEGLLYYEYGTFNDRLNIRSTLLNAVGGIQFITKKRFVFDVYLGAGYKNSSKSSSFSKREYHHGTRSFAYNGNLFLSGFRIGYQLR